MGIETNLNHLGSNLTLVKHVSLSVFYLPGMTQFLKFRFQVDMRRGEVCGSERPQGA